MEARLERPVVRVWDQIALETDHGGLRSLFAELGERTRAVLKARHELERGLTVAELHPPRNGRPVLRARAGIEARVEPQVVLEAELE